MSVSPSPGRAFAVHFKDLARWSVNSFFTVQWKWPSHFIKPLSTALQRKDIALDRNAPGARDCQLVTLHFGGEMEARQIGDVAAFKGRLYSATPGDVIYSRIDVRNGAIGVVPESLGPVAVSSEYPVYRIHTQVAIPEYIKLMFRTSYFRKAINAKISGASGRKRVQPSDLAAIDVPLPPLSVQQAIVALWEDRQQEVSSAEAALDSLVSGLDADLRKRCRLDVGRGSGLSVSWSVLACWDVKSARAAAFRTANPTCVPLGEFVEEVTDMAKPWEDPEKEWPVYGVNNRDGVFFSHLQNGRDFHAPYKRIRKDWFFHNPTRSSVGSLGIVPDVPEDAITSPEYQVWRIKRGLVPGYVATLISTPFFVELIQFHRVGAVKQRLYAANLMEICIPSVDLPLQEAIAGTREAAIVRLAQARQDLAQAKTDVDNAILGSNVL